MSNSTYKNTQNKQKCVNDVQTGFDWKIVVKGVLVKPQSLEQRREVTYMM